MAQPQKKKIEKSNALSVLTLLLSNKKEINSRVKNGEDLRAVAHEKGLKIVFPI